MSWGFSLAWVEACSRLGFWGTESCARLRSMRIAERSSFGDKRTEPCPPSPSGTTSGPSTVDPGVGLWILSLRASRAKRSRPRVGAEAGRSATSGKKRGESYLRSDPNGSSWRTSCGDLLRQRSNSSTGTRTPSLFGSRPATWGELIVEYAGGGLPTPTTKTNTVSPYMIHKWPANRRWAKVFGDGLIHPHQFEWMLDWPIGWTALEPLEGDRFRSWQLPRF